MLYNEFKNIKNNNETIISSVDQFKMEFSSWVKSNDKFMVKCLEDFVKNSNINKYVNEQKEENTKNYHIPINRTASIIFSCSSIYNKKYFLIIYIF